MILANDSGHSLLLLSRSISKHIVSAIGAAYFLVAISNKDSGEIIVLSVEKIECCVVTLREMKPS